MINYACAILFLKMMAYPLRYGICGLIITISLRLLVPFFSLFLISIYPGPFSIFLGFFFYPCRSRTPYLSHTSRLPVSSLYHYKVKFSWELPLEKHFFLLDSLTFHKIYVTICLFISFKACFPAARKHALDVFNQLGPWWVSFLLRSVHLKNGPVLQAWAHGIIYVEFTQPSSQLLSALPVKYRTLTVCPGPVSVVKCTLYQLFKKAAYSRRDCFLRSMGSRTMDTTNIRNFIARWLLMFLQRWKKKSQPDVTAFLR